MTDKNKHELYQDPPTGLKNNTDYDFPTGWHTLTPEQKNRWFIRERVFRQAIRQNTAFGRRYRSEINEPQGVPIEEAWKRADRGGFKHND